MGAGVWSVVLFMINGFAFLLIGVRSRRSSMH